MSIRWRKSGELLCGAKSKAMKTDFYIGDQLQYDLSLLGIIEPHEDEETTGLWRWRPRMKDIAEVFRPDCVGEVVAGVAAHKLRAMAREITAIRDLLGAVGGWRDRWVGYDPVASKMFEASVRLGKLK